MHFVTGTFLNVPPRQQVSRKGRATNGGDVLRRKTRGGDPFRRRSSPCIFMILAGAVLIQHCRCVKFENGCPGYARHLPESACVADRRPAFLRHWQGQC